MSSQEVLKGSNDAKSRRRPVQVAVPRRVGPGLVRLHRAWPGLQPADLQTWVDRRQAAGDATLAWSDPRSRLLIVGAGRCQERTWRGSARFRWARSFCSKIRERLVDFPGDAPPPGLPLIWQAFTFAHGPDPVGRQPECWQSWPQALMRIPRLAVYCLDGGSGVVAHAWVPARVSVDRIRDQLDDALDALTSELREPSPATHPASETTVTELPERATWEALVGDALTELTGDGELEKLVLARAKHHRLAAGRFSPSATYGAARARERDADVFLLGLPDRGSLVGATPEVLIRVQDGKVSTQALAGSAARGATPTDDLAAGEALLASEKDRAEHRHAVEVIKAALEPRCTQLLSPPVPTVQRLPRIMHLTTPFRGTLAERVDLLELVEALHPTPSLGGRPRRAAIDWLSRHEELARGAFGGLVGWQDERGEGLFAVAIRSALLRERDAWTFAGAGIVPGSDPAAEWEETALKLASIDELLQVEEDR